MLDVFVVDVAIPRRQQQRHVTPDDLLRRVPEDLLGALIEVDDVLLLIDADDRIGGNAKNARELRLGLAQRAFSGGLFGDTLLELALSREQESDRAADGGQRRETKPRAASAAPELRQRERDWNDQGDGGDPQRRPYTSGVSDGHRSDQRSGLGQ